MWSDMSRGVRAMTFGRLDGDERVLSGQGDEAPPLTARSRAPAAPLPASSALPARP
eukprot:COSAG04_NODE_323_length_16882_cov_5.975627_20_plen_56_part_00